MRVAEQRDEGHPESAVDKNLQKRVAEQAKRFDLAALMSVLHWLGYQREEIELRSHDTSLQQSAVVQAVHFVEAPRRRVQVVVNLGWLAPQSALPAYFRSVLDQDRGDLADAFLSFFNHVLLRAGIDGCFPDRNPSYFAAFEQTSAQLRSLLGVRSLSTIHWVFAQTFPEAETCVGRTILSRPLRNRGMVLGDWAIGDGMSCGGQASIPVSAVAVTLYCSEPCDQMGTPWAIEAERRLHRECFTALASPGLFLRVLLVIRDQHSFMVLQNRQYLGYEALSGAAPGSSQSVPSRGSKVSRTIVLWSGEVPPRAIGPPPGSTGPAKS